MESWLFKKTVCHISHFRISLTLSCPMDLKLYPLDRQTCELRIASCKFMRQLCIDSLMV